MKKTTLFTLFILSYLGSIEAQRIDSILRVQATRLDSMGKRLQALEKNQPEAISLLTEITEVIKNPVKLITGSLLITGVIFLLFYLLRLIKPDWYTVLIQNWIDRYTGDNVLRREKSILLLYPTGGKTDFIERFFKKYQFKYEKVGLGESYAPLQDSRDIPDIFFAFDEDKVMSQEALTSYLEQHDETLLFYFGQTGAWDFKKSGEKKLNSRINLANARAQIFANLMSTLKYHSATTRSLPLT